MTQTTLRKTERELIKEYTIRKLEEKAIYNELRELYTLKGEELTEDKLAEKVEAYMRYNSKELYKALADSGIFKRLAEILELIPTEEGLL